MLAIHTMLINLNTFRTLPSWILPGLLPSDGLWYPVSQMAFPLWMPILRQITRFEGRRMEDRDKTSEQLIAELTELRHATDRKKAGEALHDSEEDYRRLTELLPDAIFIVNGDRIAFVNSAGLRLLGASHVDQIVGRTVLDFIHPEDQVAIKSRMQSTYENQRLAQWLEQRAVRLDGSVVHIEAIAVPFVHHGCLTSQVIVRDITDRKKAEEALQQSEQRQKAILDTIPDPAWLKDKEGRYLAVNAAWCHFLDTDANDALGKTPVEFFPPEIAPKLSEQDRIVVKSRHSLHYEELLTNKDGRPVWFETIKSPLFNDHGDVVGTTGLARDITVRKKAEEGLRASEANLREAQEVACLGFYVVEIAQRQWSSSEVLDGIFDVQADYAWTEEKWGDLVHPDERQSVLDYFREVLGKHKPFDREYRIVRYGDHQVRWVHGLGRLEFDSEGRATRMLGTIQDITERKQAEEALRKSEARYRSLFDNNLDGIFLTRPDGVVEDANPAACSMLGMSREEIVRVGRAGVIDPNDPRLPALLEQRDRMGRINCELTCIRKEGQKFPAEISSVVLDGHDEERQAFVMVRDITERKRLEQEKLEMERRLLHAQKLESLGILAGGIAHDFNNILAGIMGYADLSLVELPVSEPVRANIEIIKKSVRRAADLTRQMLAYSGKGKFIVEPVSLSLVVKEMRAMLEMSISKKATLNCNLASDLPMIEADASQIHQIILNLVINASEALGEDSGVIAVSTDTIQCSGTDCAALGGDDLREGLYVRLEVSDTGCGMDEQTLAKIFDPFFTTKFTGRGLGLAAVHGILRGHKGGIRVTSKPGQGTTFQVLFPAIETSAPVAAAESIPAKPWRGTGTVLVVDDEEIVRSLAKRMVEVAGFSVLTANDGEEAVRLYHEHQDEIACVLLDLTMPKMGGEETFRMICQISPGVRVILSSGYSEETATGRFAGLGLAGFIQKPYQLDTMIATLRDAVTGRNKE